LPSFNEACVSIVSRFDAAMIESHPAVIRVYGNQHPGTTPPPATSSWVRFSILSGGSRLMELGSRTNEALGRATAQIFTPAGTGEALSRKIADSVRDALQGVSVDGVNLYATEITNVLIDPGSPWYQLNASTRFRFESTPT
jgi:hypothetical protein